MKIVIEAEEVRKLLSMYVKSKLKCDIDFAASSIDVGTVISPIDEFEFRLVVKMDEKV